MTAVGWKARERKWERGNQYQYWVNTSMPTTPSMFVWPVLHTTFLSICPKYNAKRYCHVEALFLSLLGVF
jgi:hypothetical protein